MNRPAVIRRVNAVLLAAVAALVLMGHVCPLVAEAQVPVVGESHGHRDPGPAHHAGEHLASCEPATVQPVSQIPPPSAEAAPSAVSASAEPDAGGVPAGTVTVPAARRPLFLLHASFLI